MAAYLSWSMEILVTNIPDSTKWSNSKQLAGYTFTLYCSTAPISNVTMPVNNCKGGKFLRISLCLAPPQDPRHKSGKVRPRRKLVLLDIISMLFTLLCCNLLNTCPVIQPAWLSWLKCLLACRLALIGQSLRVSTSNNNDNNHIDNNNDNKIFFFCGGGGWGGGEGEDP